MNTPALSPDTDLLSNSNVAWMVEKLREFSGYSAERLMRSRRIRTLLTAIKLGQSAKVVVLPNKRDRRVKIAYDSSDGLPRLWTFKHTP